MSNAIAAREQDKQGLTLPAAVPPLHAAGELGEGPHFDRADRRLRA